MKDLLLNFAVWLKSVFDEYGEEIFWGTVGSSIAVVKPKTKKSKEAPRLPVWYYIVKFLAGFFSAVVASDYAAVKTGMPVGVAGFIIGLIGYGLCGFLIESSSDPVKLYKKVRTLEDENEDTDK